MCGFCRCACLAKCTHVAITHWYDWLCVWLYIMVCSTTIWFVRCQKINKTMKTIFIVFIWEMTVIGNFELSFQTIWSFFSRWSNVNSLSIIQRMYTKLVCICRWLFLLLFVAALLLISLFEILIAIRWTSFSSQQYIQEECRLFFCVSFPFSTIVHFLFDSSFILCVDKWTR